MNPDYSRLYLELDLQPTCGVDELRQAYRRHMANRHPDRGEGDGQETGRLPLPDLNAIYHEALRFHLRYGRLPGATQPRAPAAAARAPRGVPGADAPSDATSTASRLGLLLLLVAAVVAGSMLASRESASAKQGGLPAIPGQGSPTESLQPLPDSLALGMDIDTVLAIQGEPVHRNDDHWDYGPSWLRFERGKLVDWYSSRLSPLRTATPSPPPEALEGVDVR